jgi:hypothetical protein
MRPYKKIFQTNPGLLERILEQGRNGEKPTVVAKQNHCDHSTVLYHWRVHNVTIKPEVLLARRRKDGKDFRGVFHGMKYEVLLEQEFIDPQTGKTC